MEVAEIQALFRHFLSEYDSARKAEVWEKQRQLFKRFWNDKILSPASELTVDDTDAIIRLLDTKGRGRQRKDEAVANTGGSQGRWERLFDSLKNKLDIRRTLDEIFAETDDSKLIGLIDRLEKENKNNKNSLTGNHAVILDAFLFINNPAKFLSIVSLSHRFQVMRGFGLGDPDEFETYGEKIVLSNRRIIDGFRDKYGIEANPRDLSEFLYTPHSGYTTNVKIYWQKGGQPITEPAEVEFVEISEETSEAEFAVEFAMEKHLEDFLVRNWESTELGEKYDLIEEGGDLVSQQYPTDVGKIDLLVKDKETKQFVVIELKKSQTSDVTVGQVARYMGWVKKHLADGQEVNGIIISRYNDPKLQYALQMVPNVELFVYKVSFALDKAVGL
ncbi:MAG TPA: PDDEXK nuclease domain-containing protein [Pyrinomonadaceae bacterium]|jgi:predicted nuclease of restriction endonuclease-like (RecB) superfamily